MTATVEEITFKPWPKTPRLFRDCIITEKIDGTNAAVGITQDGALYCQSRNRLITPDEDNAGFARWAADNAGTLTDDLGPGLHFGEWWGKGIQRGYGIDEKRFSLFNVDRFQGLQHEFYTPNLDLVPVLRRHTFDTDVIDTELYKLTVTGSQAAPGFMRPEGIVVFHSASRQVFKALIENDQSAKSDLRNAA